MKQDSLKQESLLSQIEKLFTNTEKEFAMAAEVKKQINHKWGAWVRIKWKPGTPEDAWMQWKNNKEIKEAWTTTGKWDLVLWIGVDNPDEVERIVWKEIRGNKWVENTDTSWAKKYW